MKRIEQIYSTSPVRFDSGRRQRGQYDDTWIDARGRAEPWPVRVTVRSGRPSTLVNGELLAEKFGLPEASARLPAASPVDRAILASGVFDASIPGGSMHATPIPKPLLARQG